MNRRDFIKTTAVGSIALTLPISIEPSYTGICKAKSEYCMGSDFYPMAATYGLGPLLCEYHGMLIKKLKLLTLPELEHIARNTNRAIMDDILKVAGGNHKQRISLSYNEQTHRIRLQAMRVSDQYWKSHHREIFGLRPPKGRVISPEIENVV